MWGLDGTPLLLLSSRSDHCVSVAVRAGVTTTAWRSRRKRKSSGSGGPHFVSTHAFLAELLLPAFFFPTFLSASAV